MSGSKRQFTLIGEEDAPAPETPPKQPLFTAANANILLLSLRALSQRTALEIARLGSIGFTAGLVVAVWLLVARVLPDPSELQLIGLAGFAVFCLLIDIVRRRK
jgi:hypothetical protein